MTPTNNDGDDIALAKAQANVIECMVGVFYGGSIRKVTQIAYIEWPIARIELIECVAKTRQIIVGGVKIGLSNFVNPNQGNACVIEFRKP